jgi:hypothetical protein
LGHRAIIPPANTPELQSTLESPRLSRGWEQEVTATTKGTPPRVLEQFALIQHFDHVQGTDGFPAKPEPDVLLKTSKPSAFAEGLPVRRRFGRRHGSGRRAGIPTCAVTWGYGEPEELARHRPDFDRRPAPALARLLKLR